MTKTPSPETIAADTAASSEPAASSSPTAPARPSLAFDTLQLHAGQEQSDPSSRARAVPIYATSSYTFDNAEHAAALFAGQAEGNQYGRMHNPTVAAFVARIVALERAVAGLGLSSGQAASTATLLSIAAPGKQLLLSNQLFGGTYSISRKILEPWGCQVRLTAPTPEAIEAVLETDHANISGLWLETIANPSCFVPDIAAIAALCQRYHVPLIVDNTWGCGGYLCRALELGADIVVHSATKWIGGHGSFIGGAIVDAGRYPWDNGKFPAFTALDARGRSYVSRAAETPNQTPFSLRAYDLGLFTMGMTLSPYAASLGLQGLETLSLRVQRACDSALALAQWLETQPQVAQVFYPGLASHPAHSNAQRSLHNGYGAVLSFTTHDPADAASFLNRVQLASHLANIGDAKTATINPWTTTHASISEAARLEAGVSPELIRVSVGLEALEDIQADFAQALR